jgi:MoxR-like ATPase
MLESVSAKGREKLLQLKEQLGKVILGKPDVIDRLIVALISGSHLLMEDVPGVGKTTLAKALARSIAGEFKRAQFTPDLLPTDILGSSVYNPKDGTFTFKQGPIFTNVLLADEINRASPRTQSALLEAMSERQVSIEGVTRPLPAPFLVIATQNPIEFHGTYPLPEAQLDRFAMRINLGYPDKEREVDVLFSQFHHHPLDDVHHVVDAASVLAVQETVRAVRVERGIARYLVALADASRSHPSIKMGCSPRGTLILFRMAQARAFLDGRDHAVPEDVKAVALPTLAHRLALDTKAKYSGVQKEDVVRELLDTVPVGD